MKASEEMRQTL